jgi:hypothetical protein
MRSAVLHFTSRHGAATAHIAADPSDAGLTNMGPKNAGVAFRASAPHRKKPLLCVTRSQQSRVP